MRPLQFLLLLGTAAGFAARALAVEPEDASLNELKQLSVEQLMNTEVTSVSLYPERLQSAASAIQVVTDDDIERFGSPTIPDALRLADNLDVAQKNPHDWAISARGFNSNVGDKMLVLIDGRSVYTPIFSGVFWSSQDYLMADIDRMEVISGPGGTLFGENAVNGVINITTKSAQETQGPYADVGLGTQDQRYADARYGGVAAKDVYFRVYAKTLNQGNADYALDSSSPDDHWSQSQTGFRIDSSRVTDTQMTLQGDFYSGALNEDQAGVARLAGGNVLGRWSRTFADSADWSVQAYYDRTDLNDPFAASPFSAAGPLRDDLTTLDFSTQYGVHWGAAQHLVTGGDYRWTDDRVLTEAPGVAFLPPHLEQGLYSIFLQDEIRLADQFYLIAGSKAEHNGYSGFEYEPNLRLRWTATPRETFWTAVSRAIRAPARFDTDLAEPKPPPEVILGNPHFSSETLIAYEAGWRAQVADRFAFSASVYYNQYDRLRSEMITPVTFLPVVFGNGLEGHTSGGEVSADWQPVTAVRFHAGYDLLREHLGVSPGQTDLAGIVNETEDPRHQAFLRVVGTLPAHFEAAASFRRIDSLDVNDVGTTFDVPAYSELDGQLAWRGPQWEVALVGRNLLHAHHPEYNPPSATREELPRSVFVKVAYRQ